MLQRFCTGLRILASRLIVRRWRPTLLRLLATAEANCSQEETIALDLHQDFAQRAWASISPRNIKHLNVGSASCKQFSL
jgi:hypothetical protein